MEIKGEASVFKFDFAKNLKQFAKKISVVLFKKNTKIVIEDKRITNVTMNFVIISQITPEQTKEVSERASQLLKEQAGIIEASGDKVFDPFISQDITLSTVSTDTANKLIIKNADYLMEGKGNPIFIKNFKNLPSADIIKIKCSSCKNGEMQKIPWEDKFNKFIEVKGSVVTNKQAYKCDKCSHMFIQYDEI